MTTLTERVETAVSTMEVAAAKAPAHIQTMQDLQTSVEQAATDSLLAMADLRLYTPTTWVSGQTYVDRRVVFNDGGINYIPVADGYTAGASIAADASAGLLVVQQGLTQSDMQANPEDTDPTKLLVPGSFGNGLDANGLTLLTTAAQWQKPSGTLALINDQTAGLPVAAVCYANWLARSDASNGYAVEIMRRDNGDKYRLNKPNGGAPVPGDWIKEPLAGDAFTKAETTAGFSASGHGHNDLAPLNHSHGNASLLDYWSGYKSIINEDDVAQSSGQAMGGGKYVLFFDDGPHVTLESFNISSKSQSAMVIHNGFYYYARLDTHFYGYKMALGATAESSATLLSISKVSYT